MITCWGVSNTMLEVISIFYKSREGRQCKCVGHSAVDGLIAVTQGNQCSWRRIRTRLGFGFSATTWAPLQHSVSPGALMGPCLDIILAHGKVSCSSVGWLVSSDP